MRRLLTSAAVICALSLPAVAQDTQGLADIRSELAQLNTDLQGLRSEMVRSGQGGQAISGDVLQRVDAIEQQLTRLTSRTEELENRINRVVADGTNRIGDIEFRLTEMEGGDLGALGETPVLGGDAGAAVTPAPSVGDLDQGGGAELAISEKADFERAQGALASGDFRAAAEQFETFNATYPGGPLAADADFFRGEALSQAGDWNTAARAYLDSFKANQTSPRAPEALYKLGLSLNELGQKSEACLMLQEVGTRYPQAPQVGDARGSMQTLGCS